MPLVTAGSGVAIGLPSNFGIQASAASAALPAAGGAASGRVRQLLAATNRQVQAFMDSGRPAFALDPLRIAAGEDVVAQALAWAAPLLRPRARAGLLDGASR